MSAYVGSDVELECRVESSPKPETMWLTGNGEHLDEQLLQQHGQTRLTPKKYESLNHLHYPNAHHHLNRYSNGDNNGGKKKYQFDEVQDGYQTIMRLTIRRLEPTDFGSYKCTAKNKLGEKEGLVRLYGR